MARCMWRFCMPPDTMALPHCAAPDGDRTHDHTLTERMLCQLSYRGNKHALWAANSKWLATN